MITTIRSHVMNPTIVKRIVDASSLRSVYVGIPENVTYRNGVRVYEVANKMEFGDGNVLPRPFVRSSRAEKKAEWKAVAKEGLRKVVSGEDGKKQKDAMKDLGDKIKSDIVAKIDEITEPPLKPETIKRKARKGRAKPEKPLIDSGKMRDSFKVVVK